MALKWISHTCTHSSPSHPNPTPTPPRGTFEFVNFLYPRHDIRRNTPRSPTTSPRWHLPIVGRGREALPFAGDFEKERGSFLEVTKEGVGGGFPGSKFELQQIGLGRDTLRRGWEAVLSGRQNGRMAEWQNGRMEEWQNGRMAEWQNGRMAEWQNAPCGYSTAGSHASGVPKLAGAKSLATFESTFQPSDFIHILMSVTIRIPAVNFHSVFTFSTPLTPAELPECRPVSQ